MEDLQLMLLKILGVQFAELVYTVLNDTLGWHFCQVPLMGLMVLGLFGVTQQSFHGGRSFTHTR